MNTLSQNGISNAVTSGNLWFVMSSGITTGAPSAVQLYAPSKWEQGSSVYHLNESAVTNPADQLMLPDFQAGQVLRSPGPIALAVLQSIGYTIGMLIKLHITWSKKSIFSLNFNTSFACFLIARIIFLLAILIRRLFNQSFIYSIRLFKPIRDHNSANILDCFNTYSCSCNAVCNGFAVDRVM